MASIWEQLEVEDKVRQVLGAVPLNSPTPHNLGRPFMTSYQIAIKLDEEFPEVAQALGVEIGGRGVGSRMSLASYLGKQLSDLVRANADHDIEGAFITNQSVTALYYIDAQGRRIESSATGTPYDLALFRLRSRRSQTDG
jgi:hypothetical protein